MDETYHEPTVLEYARFWGLTKDHLSIDPWHKAIQDAANLDLNELLEDDPGLPQFELPPEFASAERLSIDRDAAGFLREIMTNKDTSFDVEEPVSRAELAKSSRIELPILKTDHEWDMLHFGRRHTPQLNNVALIPEPVDEEKDEGLAWPKSYLQLPEQIWKKVTSEKLEIPKETIVFLKETLKMATETPSAEERLLMDINYERKPVPGHITPPLLPLSPVITPFIPHSSDEGLELLSDHDEIFTKDLDKFEQQMMEEDSLLTDSMDLDSDDVADLFSPLGSFRQGPPPSEDLMLSPKRKHIDLKVDTPLTPPMITEHQTKRLKIVTVAELLKQNGSAILDTAFREEDPQSATEDLEKFVEDEIRPIAIPFLKEVENEQLSMRDFVQRVPVPPVSSRTIVPPWTIYSLSSSGSAINSHTELESQRRILSDFKNNTYKQLLVWSGVSQIDRELPWNPVPDEIPTFNLGETIAGDDEVTAFMDSLKLTDTVDMSSLLWAPERIQILEDSEGSDDDLNPASATKENGPDLSFLLRLHKAAMDREKNHENNDRVYASLGCTVDRKNLNQPKDKSRNREKVHTSNSMLPSQFLSTSSALSRFMHVQNVTHKRLLDSFEKPPHEHIQKTASGGIGKTSTVSEPIVTSESQNITNLEPIKLPAPPIPDTHITCNCIVSATILSTQSALLRNVRKLYPEVDFIERDFHSALIREANEADIILSPATGIVLTTLQSIKQRALPGQRAHSGMQGRIKKVVPRYERLIVFVSDGYAEDSSLGAHCHLLDDYDCQALAELSAFASGLNCEVQTTYIAGGMTELAKWIAGAIAKYAVCGLQDETQEQLSEEETTWELFLRQAGFNAFAAQAVLAALDRAQKTTMKNSSESQQLQSSALPLLMLMSPAERLRQFQGLLGGTRVLSRVNANLEQSWNVLRGSYHGA